MIRGTLILLNILLALFTLCAYASPHIDPNSTYLFSFFGLFYPVLLILNFVFIFFWLFTKKRLTLISILTIILGLSNVKSFIGFNTQNERRTDSRYQILSHNLQGVIPLQKKNGKFVEEKKNDFIKEIINLGIPQVYCSQESTRNGLLLIKEAFNYPYSAISERYGTVIHSKLPIIDEGELDLKTDGASSAIWANIQIGKDTIRVYNIHLRSNMISSPANKILKEADLQSSKTWNSVRGIMSNYKNSTSVRAKQANIIASHLANSPYKTIICGDLNDTPLSHVYKILSKDKKDSFKEAGNGIGTTYAGVIPALRIDYILADKRLEIIDHQIHKGKYSDHYQISAEIVLP